ncbi:zinc-binding metallopeptidase family protein [Caldimonas brevitalea]|uniref:DNA polymerase III subunit gamma/tau n=1 Tax=Caldimonas brevitalea TaxID=413882 RepID=A0A0G3BR46_9BURK|nr:putative zinc-binding metallopeptidase [Caldimonas brevitalea]AKJ31894.1 DNA polymerase III subunit gamma/tau [Caldimonas brevitalea]
MTAFEAFMQLPSGAVGLGTPRAYRCGCGRQIFFRNSRCLSCGTPLGYVPSRLALYSLDPGFAPGTWCIAGSGKTSPSFRRCANFTTAAACNWLVEPEDSSPQQSLCKACRLNRIIPDLSQGENQVLWLRMERAKRRLVSQLIGLRLPVASKVSEDVEHGLAYDFLRPTPGRPRVMTGHHHGIITLNLDEANDAVRERVRVEMGEPYRTLLGHFRHEVGHYYWGLLIEGTHWQDASRRLFGDERLDYAAALKANYEQGPRPDWRQHFVSAYASMHPWEDWAESWAHYLHLRDTLDTAASFGIQPGQVGIEAEPFCDADLWDPKAPNGRAFLEMMQAWSRIAGVMNEMSSAMGQHDFYPFVLPRPAVAKLHFIHCVVSAVPAVDAERRTCRP